jgi:hypothetical protein
MTVLIDNDQVAVRKLLLAQVDSAGMKARFGTVWKRAVDFGMKESAGGVIRKLEQLLATVLEQMTSAASKVPKSDTMTFVQRVVELGEVLGTSDYHSVKYRCGSADVAYAVCVAIQTFCKNEKMKIQIMEKVPECCSMISHLVSHNSSNGEVCRVGNDLIIALAGDDMPVLQVDL